MEERRAHHGTLNFQHPHPHGNISTQTRCNDIGRKHANPNPNHYTCNAKRAKSTEFFHKKKKKCCLKTCSFSCCGRTPRSTWHPQLSTFTLKQGHTHPAVMQRHRSPTCRPRPKLLHMKCGKPKVHRVLPRKGKQVMFEKLLCCVLWKNSALNMAPSIFNIHTHTRYAHTAGMQWHRPQTAKPESKPLRMECEKLKIHTVLPQKEIEVMFGNHCFFVCGRTPRSTWHPQPLNIHNHTGT